MLIRRRRRRGCRGAAAAVHRDQDWRGVPGKDLARRVGLDDRYGAVVPRPGRLDDRGRLQGLNGHVLVMFRVLLFFLPRVDEHLSAAAGLTGQRVEGLAGLMLHHHRPPVGRCRRGRAAPATVAGRPASRRHYRPALLLLLELLLLLLELPDGQGRPKRIETKTIREIKSRPSGGFKRDPILLPDESISLGPIGRRRGDGRRDGRGGGGARPAHGGHGSGAGPTKRRAVLLPITVQEEEPEAVLLHGGLVGRRRGPVLELGVHHGRVGVVRPAVGGRDPREEPPAARGHPSVPYQSSPDPSDSAALAHLRSESGRGGAAESREGPVGSRASRTGQAEHGPTGRSVLGREPPSDPAHRDQHDPDS